MFRFRPSTLAVFFFLLAAGPTAYAQDRPVTINIGSNPENIKALIANVGYDADDVTAEPDAYKRLPTCCKKPEDGGGGEKKN